MHPPYRILCMTSDKYIDAVRPFMYLLNKHWVPNPNVIVAGFTPPTFDLPSNADFLVIGEPEDYPIKKWSNGLYRALSVLEDEVLVVMLEDYWLTRPVNSAVIKIMYDYMLQFTNVIKVDLRSDRLYAGGADKEYGHAGYVDLVKSMPGSPYHMSLMTGLWNRKLLLSAIRPEWTPWDVEIAGTTVLSHMQELMVLGTKQNPLEHTLAFRGGEHQQLLLDDISEVDVDELTKLGYLNPWLGSGNE